MVSSAVLGFVLRATTEKMDIKFFRKKSAPPGKIWLCLCVGGPCAVQRGGVDIVFPHYTSTNGLKRPTKLLID